MKIDELQSVLDQILAKCDEKEETDREIDELYKSVHVLGDIIREDYAKVFSRIYWSDRRLKSDVLKMAFYIDKPNPLLVHTKCKQCERSFDFEIKSWSHYDTLVKRRNLKIDEDGNIHLNVTCYHCLEDERLKKSEPLIKARLLTAADEELELKRLKTMPYREYLKTEHWQILIENVHRRDGYKCVLCSSKENLCVHHNTYENRGCEKMTDLTLLCQPCHSKHHGKHNAEHNAE